jgi:hypothetical protein
VKPPADRVPQFDAADRLVAAFWGSAFDPALSADAFHRRMADALRDPRDDAGLGAPGAAAIA